MATKNTTKTIDTTEAASAAATEEKQEQEQKQDLKGLNIFQRLSRISTEVGTVAKNLDVGYGRSSYKAVSESDVLRAVKPVEAKYGIYSYPVDREILETGVITNTRPDGSEVSQRYMRIKTTYRAVNIDDPTEYVEVIGYGDGIDSMDKAPMKAVTFSDKSCMLKLYRLATGDDPDADASLPLKTQKTQTQAQPAAPQYTAAQLRSVLAQHGVPETYLTSRGVDIDALTPGKIAAYIKRIDDVKKSYLAAQQQQKNS